MITLYGFGPMFGLPDPSPFVLKTMTQLKMAGVPFRFEQARPDQAPKGKIPFIQDGDQRIGDGDCREHVPRGTAARHHGKGDAGAGHDTVTSRCEPR